MVDGIADPVCSECHGTGKVEVHTYAKSLDLTSTRFKTIWNAIGLDMSDEGSIDPTTLITAIDSYRPGLAEMEAGYYACNDTGIAAKLVTDEYTGPKVWMGGMNAHQVEHRLTLIKNLALNAVQTKDLIIWN